MTANGRKRPSLGVIMDNLDGDDKTIINVKGVRKSSWEAAKRGATQSGISMGAWLSDQIDQAERMAREGVQPPRPQLTPEQLTARMEAIAALMQAQAALKSATGRASYKGVITQAARSLEDELDGARMANPGKERRFLGQSRVLEIMEPEGSR